MKSIVFCFAFLGALGNTWAQKLKLVVPIGHTASITSLAFSPDGKYILTGSEDGTAKLWDLSGHEIQTYIGHLSEVRSVAFSPDSKGVLTGGAEGTAKLWDLSGREIQTFIGHNAFVESVVFSADGKYILTGSRDKTAKLWDLSGRVLQTFKGHTSMVLTVAFAPNGQQVLTGGMDRKAKLWDLSGRVIQTFSDVSSVNAVAFSPNGERVLTGSRDAKLWDLSGQLLQTFPSHSYETTSVAFSPDGKQVLTGIKETATLWDLSGREVQVFKGHTSKVVAVTFSPDGKRVLTAGGADQTAKLWNLLSGHELQTFTGHTAQITAVSFSPDGKQMLIGSWDHTAKLWDITVPELKSFIGHSSEVTSAVFSSDGKQVLTGSEDQTAKLWDLSGRELQTFTEHAGYVTSVAFSPDNKQVLTGSRDNTAKLWDLSGHVLQTFSGHDFFVGSVAFSPNGKQLLTGSWDKRTKLWTQLEGETKTFKGHSGFVTSVAFSPTGKQVLTGSWDETAKLWDLSGRLLQTFKNHYSYVWSVAFSPDGKQILTGSGDRTASLWDLSGRELQIFAGHSSEVWSVAFSPDGKWVLTGSEDNTIKLWDIKTGEELATLIPVNADEWVVTTPSGLFDASPGAMQLMHYVQGLEVIELDQLKERYYEPGLLAKIMGFDQSKVRDVVKLDQLNLYPEIKANIENNLLHIVLTERSGGMGKLNVFVNGKEVQEDINPQGLKSLNLDLNSFARYFQENNVITLRAYDAEAWLKSPAYNLSYQAPWAKGTDLTTTTPLPKTRPSLYALMVGTSNYAGDRLDLQFADLDAEAIFRALESTGSALFGPERTSIRLLSSSGSTASSKANIQQAFADIATKAKPEDVLVVYFSGHGLAYGDAEKAKFYYLTKDIGSEDLSDQVVRNSYTISSDEFTQWLTNITAQKQVMILDACNAGKVVESLASIAQKNLDPSQIRALDRMKDRTGMFILTGSAANKVSYEASQYGQGLLTYSILQGMSGLALKEGKYVDVMTLFQYARDQVPVLAKGIGGQQAPILAFPQDGSSFDIGIVDKSVKIQVAPAKPVFIRNIFQNEVSFGDDLRLAEALEEYFQAITVKGAQAELIFVDVKEYENAYSMKGLYNVKDNEVEVRGRLFKGSVDQGGFQVTGAKDNVKALAVAIIGKVKEMLK